MSDACMDGLERSDEIMEGGNEDSHVETDMADLLHRFSAASKVPKNHNSDVPTRSNLGYEEVVNHLQHLDASTLESFLKPLFDGFPNKILSIVVAFSNLVATHQGVMRKCADNFLALFKWLLPQRNHLPSNMYQLKKLTWNLGLDFTNIHACSNGCVLFRKNKKGIDRANLVYCRNVRNRETKI